MSHYAIMHTIGIVLFVGLIFGTYIVLRNMDRKRTQEANERRENPHPVPPSDETIHDSPARGRTSVHRN